MQNSSAYSVHLYRIAGTGRVPVLEYLASLSVKEQAKMTGRIRILRDSGGRLSMPYARYLRGGVWELRSDVQNRLQRITYATVSRRKIILLHGFTKKGDKTPGREIELAMCYLMKNKTQKRIVYPSFEKWAAKQEQKSKTFRETAQMEYWRVKVALAIAEARKRKKLTQGQLAKLTGMPRPIIARAESGQQNLTIETAGRIFAALGLDLKLEETKK